ncbi:ecto-NOX disulfide-thiol exchanger 2-like isoform X1 [Acipenser oxyrinchus oxyrinchus]|uniref:Ecto-NOX disulfide-thiol exchanger 2-like isoform X1 n=1 Tax=Acipenser oxyrinchus oxyrinchus TaxID=40147 RepID=A0AAD8CDQ9_ACIOX|nr:ecto-NOX disulfide-thiol exchanger 2-like isoform X1 [Acipenser oxyrinchus oxyrinchus]
MAMDSSPMGMPMSDPGAWATAMNNLGMAPMGMTGQPLMSDFDPGLGMMTGIAPMNPMMPGLGVSQDMPVVKEIIHCKSCTLFLQTQVSCLHYYYFLYSSKPMNRKSK